MDLSLIYNFAQQRLEADRSGHDWLHALRVEKNAVAISPANLSANELEIIKASCWLHDTIDPKLEVAHRAEIADVDQLLTEAAANTQERLEILDIIQNLSYSKNLTQKQSLSHLGQIVQDADRLDAIGAIGIARAFYYGGSQQHALYNNEKARHINQLTEKNYRQQSSVINHFHEKLLHLEKTMNTKPAKKLAQERTAFMQEFLRQFSEETNHPFT